MGILVEELVKKLVKKLVDEKCSQEFSIIQCHAKEVLPSCVGKFAKLCREICHPV
jgi:ethanolamine utilization protein EutQ (cupin superfamily)